MHNISWMVNFCKEISLGCLRTRFHKIQDLWQLCYIRNTVHLAQECASWNILHASVVELVSIFILLFVYFFVIFFFWSFLFHFCWFFFLQIESAKFYVDEIILSKIQHTLKVMSPGTVTFCKEMSPGQPQNPRCHPYHVTNKAHPTPESGDNKPTLTCKSEHHCRVMHKFWFKK